MEKPISIKKLKCSKCGSSQIYYRLKSNQKVCKTCGFILNLNKEVDCDGELENNA